MWSITLRHGIDTASKSFESPQTVGQLKRNESFKAGLGYGDNVNLVHNGVTLDEGVIPPQGATLAVETKCNTKASN